VWRRKAFAIALIAVCAASAAHAQDFSAPASYPEGAYWHGGALYYAEMGADRVMVVEDGAARVFFEQPSCGPTAVAAYGDGLLVLCHIAAKVVSLDASGAALREWRADDAGNDLQDPNDAYADGQGGVYFSDPGPFTRVSRPQGYVMHLSADGVLERVTGPLWYPNGVFVDGARSQLYVTEHMTGRVLRYAIEDDGALGRRRTFVDVDRLRLRQRYERPYSVTGPDGLEIGPDGHVYVAIYGAGLILRLSPEGRLTRQINIPARYVTNLSFDDAGGAYVTGAFENEEPPFPGEVRYFPHLAAGSE
jgi:sugar lactone lactonase YvrE